MKTQAITSRARLGTAMAALAMALGTVGAAAPAVAAPTSAKPAETVNISKGTGTLIRLSEPMSDIFVANDAVADVQVKSQRQFYVFGKGGGLTTVDGRDVTLAEAEEVEERDRGVGVGDGDRHVVRVQDHGHLRVDVGRIFAPHRTRPPPPSAAVSRPPG